MCGLLVQFACSNRQAQPVSDSRGSSGGCGAVRSVCGLLVQLSCAAVCGLVGFSHEPWSLLVKLKLKSALVRGVCA
jgi:hypothetical protein